MSWTQGNNECWEFIPWSHLAFAERPGLLTFSTMNNVWMDGTQSSQKSSPHLAAQGILAIFVGNIIVLVPMILNAVPGAR